MVLLALTYETIGSFIYMHYSKAIEDIAEYTAKIDTLKSGNPSIDTDYKKLIREERDYLKNRRSEPQSDIQACRYVAALQEYRDLQ